MFAMSVNFHFFFLTFFLLALSFIYSAPPLRLRRFFLLSHANLALIATFTYLLGTSLVYANKAITLLDHKLFMVVFILFFIASHLKDSKDTTGDQVENIRTLPILIGKKESYLLLSSVITLSLFFIGYFLDIGLLWTLLAVLVFVFASILFKNAEKLILGLQGSVGLLAFGYILS
jgi:4-hydroxybenzoate polyprenyltransferase